jgi:hypothetical protein
MFRHRKDRLLKRLAGFDGCKWRQETGCLLSFCTLEKRGEGAYLVRSFPQQGHWETSEAWRKNNVTQRCRLFPSNVLRGLSAQEAVVDDIVCDTCLRNVPFVRETLRNVSLWVSPKFLRGQSGFGHEALRPCSPRSALSAFDLCSWPVLRSQRETCVGCMVSLTTAASCSLKVVRSTSLRNW